MYLSFFDRVRCALLIAGVMASVLTGCGSGGSSVQRGFTLETPPGAPDPNNPDAPIEGEFGLLLIDLAIDPDKKIYEPDEQVPLTFELYNAAQSPARISVAGSVPDVAVLDSSGHTVWQLSHTSGYVSKEASLVVAPGSTIFDIVPFSVTWNQRDQDGHPLSSGKYRIRAWLNATNIDGVTFTPEEARTKLHANTQWFNVP